MGRDSCLAEGVECYNVARIRLGDRAIVSQRSFLCTASHDYDSSDFALIGAPISLGDDSWVAAEAFIAPGVMIGAGSVVLARAVVTRDVDAWTVVGGNPAKGIRSRRRDGKAMTKP